MSILRYYKGYRHHPDENVILLVSGMGEVNDHAMARCDMAMWVSSVCNNGHMCCRAGIMRVSDDNTSS